MLSFQGGLLRLQEHPNLPPSQPAPVVRHNPKTGERSLDVLRWGLIPHFECDPAHARMLNNARAETVAKLPSFRGAFAARRCLVPAEAFYEWKRDGKLKQPFAIARADGARLAFGGIWESWTDPANGDVTRSFAIVTTASNGTMAPIHDLICTMPVKVFCPRPTQGGCKIRRALRPPSRGASR